MSEIQSAEEFANMIYLFKNIIDRNNRGLISDIRARDKAIGELYVLQILKLLDEYWPMGSAEAKVKKAINIRTEVLRDLGIE